MSIVVASDDCTFKRPIKASLRLEKTNQEKRQNEKVKNLEKEKKKEKKEKRKKTKKKKANHLI